mmetsp:Transcript_23307/g.45262  ORF Transcript_23307/g.45262 Transcript_23307/m.45262 type:complete len:369 (+) Transcript_23307:67-1173(+)|eukprot:CAMPEP_0172668606 /NCGR_PEP_ID=MMETSP1074-20121228/9166_1 /TAXON_ID=2916 /ORGANISM="Ceratium fusus, Strain PA161109" /LENGTH=368 /DNA_ID=CAMNT_0013485271 /DNA_START=50 /DNA_END=1156 /DNA_ORIENTATION=+
MEAAVENTVATTADEDSNTMTLFSYAPCVNPPAAPLLPMVELSLPPGSGGYLPGTTVVPFPVVQGTLPMTCDPAFRVQGPACPAVPAANLATSVPVVPVQGPTNPPVPPAANMAASVPVVPVLMACPPAVDVPAVAPGVVSAPLPVIPLAPGVTPGCSVSPLVQNVPHQLLSPAPAVLQKLRQPPFGQLHRFHPDTATTGYLSEDGRRFTKDQFQGRLSVTTEDQVHCKGVMRYVVRFSGGEVSSADGVGFIFSPRLPCPKNIQRIVSIFVNRSGRICTRAHAEVIRSDIGVKKLEVGDWVEVTVDLDQQSAAFAVWPQSGGVPSTATVSFGNVLRTLRRRCPTVPLDNCGYFACVVKHLGVTVELGS